MPRLALTLACGDYEILRALKEGEVEIEDVDLTMLTDMDSTTRHWRFLRNREFDAAEVSASYYIVARDQDFPFRALPVFPHRRFRHGFVFINTGKGIEKPADLAGKRIGVKAFLVTAVHWMRGILEEEYGVPVRSIRWFCELDEDIEFPPPPGLDITRLGHDQSVETMLAEGALDAVLHSSLIKPLINKDPRVARLFPDYRADEVRYYRKTGIFPIMHVLGLKQELVERHPWVAKNLYRALEESKNIALKRMADPTLAPVVFYDPFWREEREIFGADPWEYGLGDRNRHNFSTLVRYAHEQGLISRDIPLEELFLSTD